MVNALVFPFQEMAPPENFCVTTSSLSVWSAVGAPSSPVAPPSFVHAAFIAPRTMTAPKSGVQKITGRSAAAKLAILLIGARPPSSSLLVGKPRSPSGPPTLSYLASTCPVRTLAPVVGL